MLKIAICDDDPMYLAGAQAYIKKWSAEVGEQASVFTFNNGDSLLRKAEQSPFDIIFLDIIMPLLNGIDAAKELRKTDTITKIVFLTTSDEFALQGYSVKASDYLLKPITYEKMKEALNSITTEISKEPESISVKIIGGYRKLFLYDIEFLEASNKKVIFTLKSGDRIESLDPLYIWEKALSKSHDFYKCHRSYLVNMVNIDYFDSSVIHTVSKKTVPIARGCAKDFENTYFSVMFSE